MSKSAPSAPTPANPTTVANAQTTSNIGTAAAQEAANNINQVGPNGTVTYNQSGTYTDPTTGTQLPTYTQTTNLDPLSQAILTGTKQAGASLVPTAQALATQAGTSATTPLNFGGVNNNIIQGGPQALNQSATDAIYAGDTALLDPTFKQQQTDLQDQLSRRGIDVGSDAYSNAQTQLGTQQAQQRTAALGSATGQGITSANNMFGMALQGQQQNLSQQQLAQSNPLNLLSQIYGGANGSATA